jgi:Tol biopolymer transport system component
MNRWWISALALSALSSLRDDSVRELHVYHPRSWYADCLAGPAYASADGRFLVYSSERRFHLKDTRTGTLEVLAERLEWDEVVYARFVSDGQRLIVRGRVDGQRTEQEVDLDDGSVHARRSPSKSSELIQTLQERAPLSAWAESNDESLLATLVMGSDGWSELTLFELEDGSSRVVASGLDASYQRTTMAWSHDDSRIYLSLVGPEHGTLEDKQDPLADRDLDIYALVLETGVLEPVVVGPGDDLVTGVTAEELLWTRSETSMRVGVLSIDGGEITEVVGETASYPYWHPDGDRISVMFGAFHVVDWALNWDLGVVAVDAEGHPQGELEPVVVGNHEDFALSWSPDGRWMAYHSHRSPAPAISYSGNGATDDIWMRPAVGGAEVKLSRDAGFEICQPEWSPDGYEIVFVAANQAGHFRPVIIEIDPEQGTPVAQRDFIPDGVTGNIVSACFSPVAPELALEEDLNGERRLWIVSLDGSENRLLGTYRSTTELSGCDFTPDGESVVYCALAGAHAQVFRVGVWGEEAPVQLTHDDEEKYVPQVSPDGERVAVTVYTHTKTVLAQPLRSSSDD